MMFMMVIYGITKGNFLIWISLKVRIAWYFCFGIKKKCKYFAYIFYTQANNVKRLSSVLIRRCARTHTKHSILNAYKMCNFLFIRTSMFAVCAYLTEVIILVDIYCMRYSFSVFPIQCYGIYLYIYIKLAMNNAE